MSKLGGQLGRVSVGTVDQIERIMPSAVRSDRELANKSSKRVQGGEPPFSFNTLEDVRGIFVRILYRCVGTIRPNSLPLQDKRAEQRGAIGAGKSTSLANRKTVRNGDNKRLFHPIRCQIADTVPAPNEHCSEYDTPSSRDTGILHRTDRGAAGRIEMALALGAQLRIDHVHVALQRDRSVGAFEFTSAAYGALGSNNLVSHRQPPRTAYVKCISCARTPP